MYSFFVKWMEKFGVKKDSIGFDYIKNTGWVTASKVLESVISYVIIVLISRYLGAEGLGQYSFIFSFVGLFFIFADLGTTGVLVKRLSKDYSQANKLISTTYRLRVLLALGVLGLYVFSLFFLGKEGLLLAMVLAGATGVFGSVFVVSRAVLRVNQNGKKIVIANLSERIIALIGALVIFPLSGGLTIFVGILVVGKLLQLIVGYLYAKNYYSAVKGINWYRSKDLLMSGFPFLLIGFFTIVYVRLDTIMLSFMKGDVVVGWYQAGYKLITLINFLPTMLLMFGFPLFSRFITENKKKAKKLLETLVKLAFLVMFPLIVVVWLLGDRVLDVIYSFKSPEAFIAFKILIIAELFVFLAMIMGQFIASDDQKRFARIAGIGAGVNIILNFLLIPKFSLYGAGVATLATYLLMFLLIVIDIRKRILPFNLLKGVWMPMLASILMGVIVWLLLVINFFWCLLLGFISYGLILVLLSNISKLFSKD